MAQSGLDKKYSVNIKEMDQQHLKVEEKLDQIQLLISQNNEADTLQVLMGELSELISAHFNSEEELMQKNRFPSYLLHKSLHDAFLRQVSSRVRSWKEKDEPPTVEGIAFLRRWFLDHILGADKLYTQFLNQKGIY